MTRKWVVQKPLDKKKILSLSREWEVSPLMVQLLHNRRIIEKDEAKEFLYPSLKNLLAEKIGSKAMVVETKDAIKDGLFGLGDVGKEFFERVGNLLILPYRNETVWFEHYKNRRVTLHGHHGGLNEEEMLVPLAITQLDKLK